MIYIVTSLMINVKLEEYKSMSTVKQKILRYGLSQIMIPFFAFIMTYIPDLAWLFFILYFVIFMSISVIIGRRMYTGRVGDREAILSGKRVFTVSSKEVQQLIMKDRYLMEDLKAQASPLLYMFLTLIVIWIIFLYLLPLIRDVTPEYSLLRFLAYVGLYELLFGVSYVNRLIMMVRGKTQTALMVLNEYVVTEKGIIGGKGITLKFPIKVKNITVNEDRRFVELEIETGGFMGATTSTKLRLYSRKARALYEYLKSKVKLVSKGG
ncbi:MAG TPA: DUF2208 domain-containing protein [Desulfurococcales archaeon]|nr:DUF2208 domain-containing protein [Desulfurococcales archaeon]